MTSISDDERRRRLARRHCLAPVARVDSVPTIADSLVALHSSDPVTVFLAIAARSNGLTVTDIERALYEERSVLRHHAMRRTLWVMTPDVAVAAHAACTRKIATAERGKSAKFVGDERWFDDAVDRVVTCVRAAAEPVSTKQIGELLPALRREIVYGAGTRHEATGSAHTRAVLVAALDGSIVRTRPAGTWIGSQYAWTPAESWAPIDFDAVDELDGLTSIVRRWLERFGPGTLDDIVWWSKATKTAIRLALEHIGAADVELSSGPGFDLTSRVDDSADVAPWVALLPGLDPTVMGWKERAWYLDDATNRRVTDRNGNIGPTVWADGHIVGGWAQRADGEIAIELTNEISREHRRLVDTEIDRVRTFVGDIRFKVRFPSPNQRTLLA